MTQIFSFRGGWKKDPKTSAETGKKNNHSQFVKGGQIDEISGASESANHY